MKQYRTVNNLMGWLTFIIAATVYCLTIEPTASFWDCPEFITTGYKLEVGHPPGAPFFMLMANLFTQFASDVTTVAKMVNYMSALMSGACILFLFWSITHLVRKLIITDENNITKGQLVTIMVPDGEIIIPEPCYVANKACIILAGGKPVPVETKLENGFVPTVTDLEKAVTDKTRAILLGYPNNPTGAIMSKEQIKAIGDWAVKHDIMIISDELYAHLTYGGKKHTMFTAFPEFKDRTVVLNGFSKAYAMTGLRLGYFTAPAAFVQAANLLHQNVVLCANITAQYGAIAALKYCENDMLAMVAEYEKRRQIMIDGFKKIGLPLYEPEGAFYVFPCIKQTGLTSMEFVEKLLTEEEVLVIPGSSFGSSGEGFIRCSYAYSEDNLREALTRLDRFIRKYTK